jgi:hypothetical protein
LIIECKKSKYPWVFFSSKEYGWGDVFCFTKHYSDLDFYFSQMKAPTLQDQIYKRLEKNHFLNKTGTFYSISYCEAFKKPDTPSEIYKAIESVLAFLDFRMKLRKSNTNKRNYYFSEFFNPVIVLQGNLFEANIEGEEIHVKESNHVQIRVDYKHDIYIVDVVTKENFENFFDMIETDHCEYVECIDAICSSQKVKSGLKKQRNNLQNLEL